MSANIGKKSEKKQIYIENNQFHNIFEYNQWS